LKFTTRLSHKSDGGYPDSYRDQKKFFQSGKKSKNRLRFFDFLPLFKILFDPDVGREGGDSTYETASTFLQKKGINFKNLLLTQPRVQQA
jgi:hypothetical protein